MELILIAHNLRSCHNVGSILRTAEGLGISRVILSGYTPYPLMKNDSRLPHLGAKIDRQIHKTALGAEKLVKWQHSKDVLLSIKQLQQTGYSVYALEQTPGAALLPEFKPPKKAALVVGREVEGLEQNVIQACDDALEIPMQGKKESFNVGQAVAIALYHCAFN